MLLLSLAACFCPPVSFSSQTRLRTGCRSQDFTPASFPSSSLSCIAQGPKGSRTRDYQRRWPYWPSAFRAASPFAVSRFAFDCSVWCSYLDISDQDPCRSMQRQDCRRLKAFASRRCPSSLAAVAPEDAVEEQLLESSSGLSSPTLCTHLIALFWTLLQSLCDSA